VFEAAVERSATVLQLQLQPIESEQELRTLRAAADPAAAAAGLDRGTSGRGVESGRWGEQPQLEPTSVTRGTCLPAPPQPKLFSDGSRVLLAAGESALLPFKLRLPAAAAEISQLHSHDQSHHPHHQQQQQQEVIRISFTAANQSFPSSVLELTVLPRGLVVDRTLHLHCAEGELLTEAVPVDLPVALPPTQQLLLDGPSSAVQQLSAACSDAGVAVTIETLDTGGCSSSSSCCGGGGRGGKGRVSAAAVHIKRKCGPAPLVSSFVVWVYGDGLQAQPLEVWQVT